MATRVIHVHDNGPSSAPNVIAIDTDSGDVYVDNNLLASNKATEVGFVRRCRVELTAAQLIAGPQKLVDGVPDRLLYIVSSNVLFYYKHNTRGYAMDGNSPSVAVIYSNGTPPGNIDATDIATSQGSVATIGMDSSIDDGLTGAGSSSFGGGVATQIGKDLWFVVMNSSQAVRPITSDGDGTVIIDFLYTVT